MSKKWNVETDFTHNSTLTIIFNRNYCSRHPFVLNPRATINFERIFTAKRWFLRIRKMPKMIKMVLFSGFEQVSILAYFWLQTCLVMFIFAQIRILDFLKFPLVVKLWPKTRLQNLNFPSFDPKHVWKCLFLPKIVFSSYHPLFITLLYFTIFYIIRGLQSILNVFSLLNADFSESEKCRKWSKTTFFTCYEAARSF